MLQWNLLHLAQTLRTALQVLIVWRPSDFLKIVSRLQKWRVGCFPGRLQLSSCCRCVSPGNESVQGGRTITWPQHQVHETLSRVNMLTQQAIGEPSLSPAAASPHGLPGRNSGPPSITGSCLNYRHKLCHVFMLWSHSCWFYFITLLLNPAVGGSAKNTKNPLNPESHTV